MLLSYQLNIHFQVCTFGVYTSQNDTIILLIHLTTWRLFMNTNTSTTTICPVTTTIQLIGGKYKAIILWHLTNGIMRFGQIKKIVPTATAKMLTQQLRELENDGLIVRTVYPVVPPKVEYGLTEMGLEIVPILECMYACGEKILERYGKRPNCGMK